MMLYSKAMERWIVLTEAAEISGYHPDSLRRLLREGNLAGKKIATVWLVDRQDLMRFMAEAQERGVKGRPKRGD